MIDTIYLCTIEPWRVVWAGTEEFQSQSFVYLSSLQSKHGSRCTYFLPLLLFLPFSFSLSLSLKKKKKEEKRKEVYIHATSDDRTQRNRKKKKKKKRKNSISMRQVMIEPNGIEKKKKTHPKKLKEAGS